MFQSFTGNTKRPRQVNLSGKSSNPFAASSFGSPQSAVDVAREDRARRQQERQRLQASSQIQRVWRGHTARRKTFAIWRSIWDDSEKDVGRDGAYPTAEASLSQLDRLLLFFSPKRDREDIRRLNWYGYRQASTAQQKQCEGERWSSAYSKLVDACLAGLVFEQEKQEVDARQETLNVLTFATTRARPLDAVQSKKYFEVIAGLKDVSADSLQPAILAPLSSPEAYTGLLSLLSHPHELPLLQQLKSQVDSKMLAAAVTQSFVDSLAAARQRLWLLGNLLFLCGISSRQAMDDIARLLGSLALEVNFDSPTSSLGNVEFDKAVLSGAYARLPLNTYLADQFSIITSRETIRNLLSKDLGKDARTPANMALTLLRCFPRKADEIRMWLYSGSTSDSGVPSTLYFWQAMRQTSVFSTISSDSRAVVQALSPQSTLQHKDDWIVIMIFLELYTFLIKIVDDEEFLGRAASNRQGTIAITDVADLVIFLKNLGFTICFNLSDLNDTIARSPGRRKSDLEVSAYNIAGIPGIDLDYLKGIVTGLLRAIYERDSRRHFLSADHWLMTSRFDMGAFIPAVVQEEVNRRQLAEQGGDDDEPADDDYGMNGLGVAHHGRNGSHAAIEARLRMQQKASRQRYLEAVTPRLEILQNMPFFIPFDTRVEVFRQFVLLDQRDRRNGHVDQESWRANMMFNPQDPERRGLASRHANIRRKSEFQDAFEQFYNIGADLKEPIQITFWDEHGLQEAGIDGGGVTKEFLTSVIEQAFNGWEQHQAPRFFKENDTHLLYPNPTLLEDIKVIAKADKTFANDADLRDYLRSVRAQFEFLGRVIGKCLYEGILIDVNFAGFFLKKWSLFERADSPAGGSGYRANINDLRDLDEGLYKGLLDVKNAPDASAFDLNFTVDDIVGDDEHQVVLSRPLIPNGAQTAVTNESRLRYIQQMSWWRLEGQSAEQTKAFLKGLSTIIAPSWLSMFNQSELQTLIGGATTGIDVQDLRRNTQYGGTYVIGDDGEEHPSVKMFWKVMQTMPDADRQKVLKFVTSTPRGPLLGFAHLNPKFSIRDSGSDENRFPTTSTCVNLLKLPMYKSESLLRQKLLYAVNSGAGFDLS